MMMIIATAMMTTAPRIGQLPAWPTLWPYNIHSTDTELQVQVTGGYSLLSLCIITTALMTTAPRVGQLPAWPTLWPDDIYSTDTELQVTGGYSL